MKLEAFPQVSLRKTEEPLRKRGPSIVGRSGGQRFIHPPVSGLLAAVDALGVHPQQHLHAVTCTVSYVCGRDPAIQPQRHRSMTQVVGPALALMLGLAEEIDTAIAEAVKGLRACGYSWAEIGSRLGITRQAAQQRWGSSA
jgi:hypothetical protein